jgi:DHA1 family bicyclomycin/chloramphenicol resistance-like MFS transporter
LPNALPETRPAEKRIAASLRASLRDYGRLLCDRHYLGVALTGGFALFCFYIFLANSSFVFVGFFGLKSVQYSLVFSLNAIGFIGVAQFSSALTRRFGFSAVVRAAVAALAATTTALFVLTLVGLAPLIVVVVRLVLSFACLGLVLPTTVVMALETYGPIAGTAVALMGTIHLVGGAVAMALTSLVFDGSPLTMVAAIATCSVCSFILSHGTLAGTRTLPTV